MFTHNKKNIFFLLIILIIFSVFLRFYNLNWGAPFYFHPDERNIASSVSQLSFPAQMNPHFFAYGSLPIYTIYFTGVILNLLSHISFPLLYGEGQGEVQRAIFAVSFEQAIIISRFFSAFFSLALIPLLFFIGKKLKDERTGLITAFFATGSVGLIQFAHFGTFEMWLTFFSTLLLWLCLKLLESGKIFIVFLLGVTLGILVATKVSHLVLLPLPLLALLFQKTQRLFERPKIPIIASDPVPLWKIHGSRIKSGMTIVKELILFFTITTSVYLLTNPFILLDYSSFSASMKYESDVALGTLPVFYTGEFVNALPTIFQLLHIYPFLINPLLTALFIPSFLYLLFVSIKKKNRAYILLNIFCLILFLSQAFLYTKWTRYIVPTLPFIYLICAIALTDFWKFLSRKFPCHAEFISASKKPFHYFKILKQVQNDKNFVKTIKYLVLGFLIGINFLFAISYFITAFIREDTRIAAKNFAKQYILSNASILSEVYDMGITPFNDSYPNIKLYNFYDLDNNSPQYTLRTLAEQLTVSDYIILPSQRILKTRLQEAKAYPNGHVFYSTLLEQANGFQKIYETPCDIFCRITYLGSPVYSFEETANVFDRPTVFIFKKN